MENAQEAKNTGGVRLVGLKFNWSKSEFQVGLNKFEEWGESTIKGTYFQLWALPAHPARKTHSIRVTFRGWCAICNWETRIALCMCVSPRFGRYAEIRANAGDLDQDCGKIVTIGGISGFGRNPTLGSGKPVAARRRSQNLHVSTFANLHCGLSWSMPGEQLWISCEPVAAALSWMNFYFAAFDLLTQQHPSYWKKLSYKLPFNFVPFDIYRMESELCFEALSDCHEMEISSQKQFSWDLSVYLKQMFSRVRVWMHRRQLRSKAFWVHLLPSTLFVA